MTRLRDTMITDRSKHPGATDQTNGHRAGHYGGAGPDAQTGTAPFPGLTDDLTKTSVRITLDPTDTNKKERSPGWRSLGATA